jgi:cytoskeletal protein CcmA (bactofilin family)
MMRKMVDNNIPEMRIRGSTGFHLPGLGRGKISGSGRIGSDEIRISGSAHLPGGISVERFHKSGRLRVNGDLTAREMDFSGSTKIFGDLTSDYLEKSGSLYVEGTTSGSTMKISGSTDIKEDLILEDWLRGSGSLKVGGILKAENRIELSGGFNITGQLITKELNIRIKNSDSRVDGGIQADHIKIRSESPWRPMGFLREGELITTDIRGKVIHIEKVRCQNISGEEVSIGPGCLVTGGVIYTKSIEVHPEARLNTPPTRGEEF